MRREFERAELPLDRFGWASVQLDGGIDRVIGRVQQWFATRPGASRRRHATVRLGALDDRRAQRGAARAAGGDAAWPALVNAALASGGTVLIPEGDPLVADADFRAAVLGDTAPRATLAYGQPVALAGLHLVQTDTDHWVENVTGLAACGAHLVVGAVGDGPQQGHPLVPGAAGRRAGRARACMADEDVDFVAAGAKADPDRLASWCSRRRGATPCRRRRPPASSNSSSPAVCSACRRNRTGPVLSLGLDLERLLHADGYAISTAPVVRGGRPRARA